MSSGLLGFWSDSTETCRQTLGRYDTTVLFDLYDSSFSCCLSSHLFSVPHSLSQAHGPGRPQELYFLAESERRRHSVRSAGLRHVQSTSQAPVIRRHETTTSSPPRVPLLTVSLPSSLKDLKDWLTNRPSSSPQPWFDSFPQIHHKTESNRETKEQNHKYILYAFKHEVSIFYFIFVAVEGK